MSSILTIAKKELRSMFNSPLAYIFINVFLIVSGFLFFESYFLVGQATMRAFFELIPWMFLFLIPAITMRSWAEEKKLGTLELLLTSPVSEHELVLGKFLSCFAFLGLTLLASVFIPLIVVLSGGSDIGVIISSYLGSLFLGASYIAIGLLVSSLTDNQIVAFILSVAISFFFFLIGHLMILQHVPLFLLPFFQYVGLHPHFLSVARGVIDSRDIIFYVSFILLFLILNMYRLKLRKL